MYRKPNFTPVVFHNLSGYNSHLFVKNLGRSDGSIDCIPNNEEMYISFTKKIQVGSYRRKVKKEKEETEEEETEYETIPLYHQIRFIDSFKFMATSLEKLVNNLSKVRILTTSEGTTRRMNSISSTEKVYSLRIHGFAGKVKRNSATAKRSVLF